jgi:hypothetical protein
MVFFSKQMLRISIELALHYQPFEEFVIKFFEHTMWIAGATGQISESHDDMWDEEDGFFYDVLRLPNGEACRLNGRSMVGLLPLAAVAIFEEDILEKLPAVRKRIPEFLERRPELAAHVHMAVKPGLAGRRMLSIVNEEKHPV